MLVLPVGYKQGKQKQYSFHIVFISEVNYAPEQLFHPFNFRLICAVRSDWYGISYCLVLYCHFIMHTQTTGFSQLVDLSIDKMISIERAIL